jgi:undecaprenyl-diphosphatase
MLEFICNLDVNIFLFINSHHNAVFDTIFLVFTQLGNGWVIAPVLIGIVALKTPRKSIAKVIIIGTLSLSISGLINSQIKHIVNRSRPASYFEKNPNKFHPLSTNTRSESFDEMRGLQTKISISTIHVVGPVLRRNSFPSGHTNTAFSAATFLVCLYGGWFWIAFFPALLVAYSRIYLGAHFPLDTAGGALIGMLVVFIIISLTIGKKQSVSKGIPE